jgi:hypothetical protein
MTRKLSLCLALVSCVAMLTLALPAPAHAAVTRWVDVQSIDGGPFIVVAPSGSRPVPLATSGTKSVTHGRIGYDDSGKVFGYYHNIQWAWNKSTKKCSVKARSSWGECFDALWSYSGEVFREGWYYNGVQNYHTKSKGSFYESILGVVTGRSYPWISIEVKYDGSNTWSTGGT